MIFRWFLVDGANEDGTMRHSVTPCVFMLALIAVPWTTRGDEPQPPQAAAAVDAQTDNAQPPAQAADAWRFRRHNGAWWYWLPSNRWVYWTGEKWTPYRAQTYARSAPTQRYRSNSYPADQGNWGPIRYNGYGQPEWPYSQRRSGLRQLGPVPAMGGVRSLPGWGGER
jgi:hypothetical protein